MAEAKTAKTKRTAKTNKTAHKADLVEMAAYAAAETAETAETLVEASPAPQVLAPTVQPIETGAIFSSARKQGDAIRQAMSEAVAASAKGALEVNGKIIEALNIQSNAALDLWRSAIKPSPLPEAFQAQTNATRQAYQTASEQWKGVAETTALWFTRSLEPLQSAFHRQGR
jgi:hypothetical protein